MTVLRETERPERRSIWRIDPDSRWTTVLPVAFIIVSLLSLVVLPLVVSNHTRQMRVEISRLAEPARVEANQIQVDLAAEFDKIIAFQVTGQAQYREAYLNLVRHEELNRIALEHLAPQLDPGLVDDLRKLADASNGWHNGVGSGEFLARQLPQEIFTARLFEVHPSYEKSLVTASDLEIALQAAIEDRLRQIRTAESWNVSLTIILTLLALISAMLVAGLGRQMRLLAAEATRRRLDAEQQAAHALSARAAAEREELRAAFLASAAQELTASLDEQHAISTLARLVVPNLAQACMIDIAERDGSLRRTATAHRNPEIGAKLAAEIGQIRSDVPDMIARTMQERRARLVNSLVGEAAGPTGTMLLVPLVSRGQNLGIVIAVAPEGKPFRNDDLALFSELARNASLAIDNAHLYAESQQAVSAREEVLAIVSHDLRNPLNAVTLAASLLKMSETISADEREQIETIDLSAKRMSRLIEDLLDVTRLEGGKRLPIEPGPVEVSSLLEEAQELFKAQAAASSVTLQVCKSENVPPVYADRHRILQVLSNLIGNSLKFTPQGGVIIVAAEKREREVLFIESDTGPGIEKQHLGDIFSPYWQAKRAERLGAGLGLPIARGIVESHGGRIWVESEPGKGTRFLFTLPPAPAENEVATAAGESRERR
ncbi:MAG TPA: HAMP domain-containing sensor histidine kinase [Thermoanaerobaculia bacterium]|nr:HAMP domain-containing sensor histidine kinase [Thermoanaerobaculia bacterium]